jgi:hypothetical protein
LFCIIKPASIYSKSTPLFLGLNYLPLKYRPLPIDATSVTATQCKFSISVSVSTPCTENSDTASKTASNSRVPPPDTVSVLASGIRSEVGSQIKDTFREIYLVGQNRDYVMHILIGRALRDRDAAFLKIILNTQDPHAVEPFKSAARLVDVNKLPEKLMIYAMANANMEEVLETF